jgi:hypothetical protein
MLRNRLLGHGLESCEDGWVLDALLERGKCVVAREKRKCLLEVNGIGPSDWMLDNPSKYLRTSLEGGRVY